MSDSNQQQILDWIASGHLKADQLEQALAVTQSVPNAAENLRFISRIVLAFAALLLCSGVIFFFAYNWDDLSRYSKFALAQGALLLSLLPLLRVNLQQPAGEASLGAACLLVGALLALVGQTYQSGADTYQLFLVWAILITPWVALARMPALWLLLLILLNISLVLALENLAIYRLLEPFTQVGWSLFALNGTAAVLWLFSAQRLTSSRLLRWAERAINLYCLLIISYLAMEFVASSHNRDVLTLPIWFSLSALWLYHYRLRQLDLVMLSALLMASIVLLVTIVVQTLSDILPLEGLFLLLALLVMGLSSIGALWLKRLSLLPSTPTAQGAQHD